MKPIEVLYTLHLSSHEGRSKVPVVRYSDHCAKVLEVAEELEEHRACAIRRNDELIKQLERLALLCEEQATQLQQTAKHPSPYGVTTCHMCNGSGLIQGVHCQMCNGEGMYLSSHKPTPRWDGKPKAL